LSKAKLQLSTASQLVIYIYNADLYRFCGAEIIKTGMDFSPKVTAVATAPEPVRVPDTTRAGITYSAADLKHKRSAGRNNPLRPSGL